MWSKAVVGLSMVELFCQDASRAELEHRKKLVFDKKGEKDSGKRSGGLG
jgi:hypothetical protein